MFETILVYTVLMVVMYTCTQRSNSAFISSTKAKLLFFIPIIAYTVVFGCRYSVGVDYPNYLEIYDNWDPNDSIVGNWNHSLLERLEFGFIFMIAIAQFFESPIVFFSLIAFLQILFIYKAYKDNKEVLAYSMIAFICTGMAMIHFQNGLRQYLAIPIFIYAFQYIIDRNFVKYFFWITIAVLFHRSAAILYLVYFLYAFRSTPYIKSKLGQYILLTISIILAFFDFTSILTDKMDALLTLTQYDVYSDSDYLLSNNKNVSIIMILQYIIYMFFVAYREPVGEFYSNDKRFIYTYEMFFIASCLFFIFFRSLIIVRILRYFISFEFIIIGYYLYYIVQQRKQSLRHMAFFMALGAFLFATYSAVILNSKKSTAAYVSYFQTNLHDEKDAQREATLNKAD